MIFQNIEFIFVLHSESIFVGESRKILSKLVLIRNHRPDTSLTVRGFFILLT